MIIEIASGVCLGIVAAAFLLKNWRSLLDGSLMLIFWALVLAALLFVAAFVWENIAKVLIYSGAFISVIVLYGIPFALYGAALKRYPSLNALVKGDAPWNTVAKLPLRLITMALLAISVATVGVGGLLGGVYLVDLVSRVVSK